MKSIDQVRTFWESNPLFTGESKHQAGTLLFYDKHLRFMIYATVQKPCVD